LVAVLSWPSSVPTIKRRMVYSFFLRQRDDGKREWRVANGE
jgi:hypothetical protein